MVHMKEQNKNNCHIYNYTCKQSAVTDAGAHMGWDELFTVKNHRK